MAFQISTTHDIAQGDSTSVRMTLIFCFQTARVKNSRKRTVPNLVSIFDDLWIIRLCLDDLAKKLSEPYLLTAHEDSGLAGYYRLSEKHDSSSTGRLLHLFCWSSLVHVPSHLGQFAQFRNNLLFVLLASCRHTHLCVNWVADLWPRGSIAMSFQSGLVSKEPTALGILSAKPSFEQDHDRWVGQPWVSS